MSPHNDHRQRPRPRVFRHIVAGIWAGMVLGTIMGFLASGWHSPVSFLFQVANEIVVTWLFSQGATLMAASVAIPAAFFTLHFLIGVGAGAAAGTVGGILSVAIGPSAPPRRGPLVPRYAGLLVLFGSFAYLTLWFLHGKFSGVLQVRGIFAALAVSALIAVVVVATLTLLARAFDRLGRGGLLATRLLRGGGALLGVALTVALIVGLARNYGRSGAAPEAIYPSTDRYKVLVVGLDGVSWSIVRPLMAEGVMPNFTRLVEGGVSGPLRSSLPPIESPTIWTTVATGKRPAKHGILGFVQRSPTLDRMVPVTNDLRQAAAFWEIAGDYGLTVDVVSWYVSWPAQPVNGVFVSERLVFPDVPNVVEPALWAEVLRKHDADYRADRDALLRRFTPYPYDSAYLDADINSREYLLGQHLSIMDYSYRKDTVAFNTAMDLLRRGQPDVFAVYFEGVDRMSHRFLIHELARRDHKLVQRLYPQLQDENADAFSNVMREYHIQIDTWLGALLEETDQYTAVMVLSDHGFGMNRAWRLHLKLDALLEFIGSLKYEQVEDGKKPGVDWSSTTMYDGYRVVKRPGRIFANIEGRDRKGAVPSEQAGELLDVTRATLESLRTQSGDRVFTEVRLTSRAGENGSQGDIEITFNEACLTDSVIHDGRSLPVSAFATTEWMPGNHRIDGIFIGYGGPFKPGASIANASILDITPTLLKLVGVPPSLDMDGRPLDRAFDKDLGRKLVQGLVPVHEKRDWNAAEAVQSSQSDSLILQQLKALGYIK